MPRDAAACCRCQAAKLQAPQQAAAPPSPLTRAHFRANLMAASLASVPELQKKALSPKERSTSRLARWTCSVVPQAHEPACAAETRSRTNSLCAPGPWQAVFQTWSQHGCIVAHDAFSSCILWPCCCCLCSQLYRCRTCGTVWNRLLVCVSVAACSCTASSHRGSPCPAQHHPDTHLCNWTSVLERSNGAAALPCLQCLLPQLCQVLATPCWPISVRLKVSCVRLWPAAAAPQLAQVTHQGH